MDARLRLWRARRRHDCIDAVLSAGDAGCVLEYVRNDRRLLRRAYPTEDAAREDAEIRLKELQRAGWVDHW